MVVIGYNGRKLGELGGKQHVIETGARHRGRRTGDAARAERRLRLVVERRIPTGKARAAAAEPTAAAAAAATVAGATAAATTAAATTAAATTAAATTAAATTAAATTSGSAAAAVGAAAAVFAAAARRATAARTGATGTAGTGTGTVRTGATGAAARAGDAGRSAARVAALDLRLREHRSARHGARPPEVDDAAAGDAGRARPGDRGRHHVAGDRLGRARTAQGARLCLHQPPVRARAERRRAADAQRRLVRLQLCRAGRCRAGFDDLRPGLRVRPERRGGLRPGNQQRRVLPGRGDAPAAAAGRVDNDDNGHKDDDDHPYDHDHRAAGNRGGAHQPAGATGDSGAARTGPSPLRAAAAPDGR